MSRLLDSQPLVVGAVLLWASGVKLLPRIRGGSAAEAAARSALPRLVGNGRALMAYRIVGVFELAVGACLVLPPSWRPEAAAAVALTAGFVAYLGYSRVTSPAASCGCMGSRRSPIGIRTFARAGLLLLASTAALFADGTAAPHPVFLAELAVIAALSPEWDGYWLLPLRRWKAVAFTRPPLGTSGEVPLAVTVAQLQRSNAYREASPFITSDVREHWDEGGWRIICYTARLHGDDVSAVFAVPRDGFEPDSVRTTFINESTLSIDRRT